MSAVEVNTLLGPVSSADMGVTLVHEHILYGYPGWEGDQSIAPFDHRSYVENGVALLRQLKALGVKTYLDAAPGACCGNAIYRQPEPHPPVPKRHPRPQTGRGDRRSDQNPNRRQPAPAF